MLLPLQRGRSVSSTVFGIMRSQLGCKRVERNRRRIEHEDDIGVVESYTTQYHRDRPDDDMEALRHISMQQQVLSAHKRPTMSV